MMGKELKASCGHCNSTNVFGMSRVVGYYSIIENWNESKQAELVDRQKGKYNINGLEAPKPPEIIIKKPESCIVC